jgi:type IV pilus assembly protein PilC
LSFGGFVVQFKYNAVTLAGNKISGKVEAPSAALLSTQLSEQGLFLLKYTSSEKASRHKKLKTPEIADFCRQLSAMLSSGIVLIRAMTIIANRDMKPHIKAVYLDVITDLQRGSTLSEAMSHQGKAFPELLINMIKSGENSGRLDQTALKMADTYDKQHKVDSKIKSAMMYPMILFVLIIVVVIVIFTFVLPAFFTMFEDMVLPLPTRVMLAISGFLTHYGIHTLVALIVIGYILVIVLKQPEPKRKLDHFKLRLPKIGKLLATIYTARFARTMSSLYVSGIPMIQSLQIARGTIGNAYISAQFDDVIRDLGNGRTLSQALSKVEGFDPKLNSIILIGEESGRLEQMLESAADQYDYDSQMATERLVAMMEPLMIVIMAVVVAFVIISVMLPIFQMYSSIGADA